MDKPAAIRDRDAEWKELTRIWRQEVRAGRVLHFPAESLYPAPGA